MTDLRKVQIAIRLTEKEKKVIEAVARIRELSIAEFVREAIFSHINQLQDNVELIDYDAFFNLFNEIKISTENISKKIEELNKKFRFAQINGMEEEINLDLHVEKCK